MTGIEVIHMKMTRAITLHIARRPQVVGELVVAFAETLSQF